MNLGLLAYLVGRAGGGRPEGAAGERAGGQERAGPCQDRPVNDAVWLAKLTERGMLRPSFVPPLEIRRLRDFTRRRADLVHDRSRYWARLEKLLERALIKISAVASTLDTQSTRAMIEARIAGERNPKVLADLAIGKMRAKRAALAEALAGQFEAHHGELARILRDQIDALTTQIDALSARVTELIAAIPAAQGIDADGATGPDAGTGPPVLPAVARLDEITGCGITSPPRPSSPRSAWT